MHNATTAHQAASRTPLSVPLAARSMPCAAVAPEAIVPLSSPITFRIPPDFGMRGQMCIPHIESLNHVHQRRRAHC